MKDENSESFGSSSDQAPDEGQPFASLVIPLLLPGLTLRTVQIQRGLPYREKEQASIPVTL